jgi:hypothetical protein
VALFFRQAGQVHQAARVAGDEHVGIGCADVFQFQIAHAGRDVREGHRKRAAETAALLAFAEDDDFHARNRAQQTDRRLAAFRAARVAGGVERDFRRVFSGPGFHAEAVDNEVRELPGAPAEFFDVAVVGLFFEFEGRAVDEHRRAGRAGYDDGRVAGKNFHGVPHDAPRGRPVPRVERRLPAAGLRLGKINGAAEVFEHFDGRARGVVEKRVAQAGGEHLHAVAGRAEGGGGAHGGEGEGAKEQRGKGTEATKGLIPTL